MFSDQSIQWLANPNYILVSGCGEGARGKHYTHSCAIRYLKRGRLLFCTAAVLFIRTCLQNRIECALWLGGLQNTRGGRRRIRTLNF